LENVTSWKPNRVYKYYAHIQNKTHKTLYYSINIHNSTLCQISLNNDTKFIYSLYYNELVSLYNNVIHFNLVNSINLNLVKTHYKIMTKSHKNNLKNHIKGKYENYIKGEISIKGLINLKNIGFSILVGYFYRNIYIVYTFTKSYHRTTTKQDKLRG